MSEPGLPREWRFYVEDMQAFCDKVLVYTQGLDRASFASDPMSYGYLGVDDDTLWSIVCDDLIPLRRALANLLAA